MQSVNNTNVVNLFALQMEICAGPRISHLASIYEVRFHTINRNPDPLANKTSTVASAGIKPLL